MKKLLYLALTIFTTSQFVSCGVLDCAISSISQSYTQTVEKNGTDPIGAYNYAKAWQSGNAGKGIALSRLGASVIEELGGIKLDGLKQVLDNTTNSMIADPNANGSEKANWVGLAAHGATSTASYFVKKSNDKKFQKNLEAFYEQNAHKRDPDSPHYDPYFDLRYEIDAEKGIIKKRDPIDVTNDIKALRRNEENMCEKEQMVTFGIIPSWNADEQYAELQSDESKMRKARNKLQKAKMASGYNLAKYYENMENRQSLKTDDSGTINKSNSTAKSVDHDTLTANLPNDTNKEEDMLSKLAVKKDIAGYSFNGIELSSEQKQALNELVTTLKNYPILSVLIVGHTCNIGTDKANFNVGLKRAQKAKEYLKQQGIEDGQIQINSLGEKCPLNDNASLKNRASNRRISWEIIK